ncbi:hypothetical protein AG0111_0g12567 [Alternaria gaisen]|uniref:Uncharacterized protein n=1 Tax=Alternaria gaisen TaxID=167740 RepID=A0ACB6F476_9PLEO|nr:hypothetical protein AG0111_0g12567 [Alternaria gaisen]
MAYPSNLSGKHGGGFDPNSNTSVQVPSSQQFYPTQSHHCGGGSYDPNNPTKPVVVVQHQPVSQLQPAFSPQTDIAITMVANDAQASVREIAPYEHAAPYQGDNGANEKQPGVSSLVRNGPIELKGYSYIFSPITTVKWGFPNFYRKPGLGYQKLGQHRHRDCFDREWTGDYDDRYISSWDGQVSKLVVQAVDDIFENNTGSTYRRTFIRNIAPVYLRLANWPFKHIDFARLNGKIPSEDYPMLCLKWFIASCMITIFISSPSPAEIASRNGGNYDPVPYQYFGYPKVAKNAIEMHKPKGLASSEANPIAERVLRPRYLCFLREEGKPAMIIKVEDWLAQQSGHSLSYVFIAYTAEQFNTPDDFRVLHEIADAAARNAGVMAYWVGCSCMPDNQLEEDVYRICDVIRGAQSLVIAVAAPANNRYEINTPDLMLQQWGSRVWTFPEVLLAPAGEMIKVYVRDSDLSQPLLVAKNQFAAQVWHDDAHVARQLIDHYEGNLILSQLELVTLALECLHKRQTGEYLPGDHSYALMGLLRVRPQIDRTDSAFQAFARLSLANGSDQLLERLICMLPKTPDQPWHSMDDAYNAKLWDILPQDVGIAGVGEDDSIILDGCRAANVRWKSFTPVAHTRRDSWKRMIAKLMLRLGGVVFIVAIALLAIPFATSILRAIGAFLLIYSLLIMGLSPWLLRLLYLGKFWEQQCWFFGFEGYMDLETIETQIFGGRLGRMKWTAAASPLSRHERNVHGECAPIDPTTDPAVAALVQRAKSAGPGEQRLFTLVDTGNMTATLFLAERPPVCFLMAGSEGGMKRIIGCSYDWTTATMYRETVLRIGTEFEDKMSRIGRVKIGFKRKQHPFGPLSQVGEAEGKQL